MSDPYRRAFDRLDRLHRQWPMPATCERCARHATTARDRICHVCRWDTTMKDWGTK